MKYALAFSQVAVASAWMAVYLGGFGFLLLWPAASFSLVAAAYFGLGPAVFGKRADGSMRAINIVLLLPYLSFTWLTWHALSLVRREPPLHQLLPRVWMGRRLLPNELPSEIEWVVDLTCEFPEPKAIRTKVEYVTLPTLDGTPPNLPRLLELVDRLAINDKIVYIHCAEGHGRTGVVAAALLLAMGQAVSPQEAVENVRKLRPGVRLSSGQKQTLERFYEQFRNLR